MVTVAQTIDTGHEDLIHGAEIDFYGLNLATCSSDNSIKVKLINFKKSDEITANFTRFRSLTSRMVVND